MESPMGYGGGTPGSPEGYGGELLEGTGGHSLSNSIGYWVSNVPNLLTSGRLRSG